MTLLDRLNQFFGLVLDTLRQFNQWRVWLVLTGFFLLNWLVLYVHYDFPSPLAFGAVSFWVRFISEVVPQLGQEAARAFAHYPRHFVYLGDFFGWSKLFLGLLLEGLVLSLITLLLGRDSSSGQFRQGRYRPFLWLWANVVLVWILLNGLWVSVGVLLPGWLAPVLTGPRRLMAFTFVLMPFAFTVILSPLFVAIPAVIVHRENAFCAIRRSLLLFVRRPFVCFFLATLVLALPVFIAALSSQTSDIVDKFRPELVYWLVLFGLLAEVPANFFWMGAAIRFLAEPEE